MAWKACFGISFGIWADNGVGFTAISFAMVDYFMDSVSASSLAIWVLAVLLALAGVKDIGKEDGNKTKEARL